MSSYRSAPRVAACSLFLFLASLASSLPIVLQADSATRPLPEPLTLEFALSLADVTHPDLALQEADLGISMAERDAADALRGVTARVHSRARMVNPSTGDDEGDWRDDSAVRLLIRKPLYDFGRSSAVRGAADAEVKGQELLLMEARVERRLEIMRRFFDVILSDLRFGRDAEATAVAFGRFERAEDRNALGQLSEIELRALETSYREARRQRTASEAEQRAARARLASTLARPDDLPASLTPPQLPGNERARPEYETLEKEALASNLQIRALQAQIEAARQRVRAARAGKNPVVHGELEAAAYSRKTETRDQLRAGVTVEVPLYTGGETAADTARSQAELSRLQAQLGKAESELRQALLEAWLDLGTLQERREEVRVFSAYRDLYFDRSQALYQMEVRTDLGDAMVQMSEAMLRAAETEYAISMTWARIDAMMGLAPDLLVERQLGSTAGNPSQRASPEPPP